ncbi:hypothetical protein P8452_07032 [Trifolium repens]|nr:hypothetical protein P8452_07032 [Trifolium repens]
MQKPIPLAMYESQVDFWYQMKTCMYSVRSSYRLARTNSVDGEHLKASGNGMIIWQLARQSTSVKLWDGRSVNYKKVVQNSTLSQ